MSSVVLSRDSSPAISSSKFLERRHLLAISKLGNIYCPSHPELPSFSELGVIEHVDQVVGSLPPADLKDLKLLLLLLSFLPSFALSGFVRILEYAPLVPTPLGAVLRMIRFGLRGIVLSLYYSGLSGRGYTGVIPRERIGFSVQMR